MIPANITSEVTALQTQINANAPLSTASSATITAIGLNFEGALNDIYNALTATSVLDTLTMPTDPNAIVTAFLGVVTNSEDQTELASMLGYVGRANINFTANYPGATQT